MAVLNNNVKGLYQQYQFFPADYNHSKNSKRSIQGKFGTLALSHYNGRPINVLTKTVNHDPMQRLSLAGYVAQQLSTVLFVNEAPRSKLRGI